MKLEKIKSQVEKVNLLAIKLKKEHLILDKLIHKKYGIHYSDGDEDEIIDCLDYGLEKISFDRFDELMKKLNLRKDRMTGSKAQTSKTDAGRTPLEKKGERC